MDASDCQHPSQNILKYLQSSFFLSILSMFYYSASYLTFFANRLEDAIVIEVTRTHYVGWIAFCKTYLIYTGM